MIPDVNGKWYHGSPLVLSDLLVGSTITQNRELARIFSHKPKVVSIDDDGHIMHNGVKSGFLYEIAESVSLEDVVPHPRTTMRPGDEWLITRSLKVTLLCETRPLAEEFLSEKDIAMLKTSGKINNKEINMKLRHSIMLGMMGKIADRFHEYQPRYTLAERLSMTKQVQGVDGIEIVYPGDFTEVKQTVAMVKDSGLAVSAVNLNVKSQKKWQEGSFTSPDPELRKQAIADMKFAMDLAAELDTSMITCCPLIDGHNYNFQVDYLKQWAWLEEGVASAAKHRDDIRISLEYKLNESRNYCILGDMGRTLFLCERLGYPHVGVTMDVGHALIAKESPAEMLSIAAQTDRLFYVHFNDNAREWDWDMLPGSVNLWDLVEMLFYMDRFGWDGWLSYDVATRDGNHIEQMTATISIVETAMSLMEKLGREKIQSFIDEGIPARAFDYLVKSLL